MKVALRELLQVVALLFVSVNSAQCSQVPEVAPVTTGKTNKHLECALDLMGRKHAACRAKLDTGANALQWDFLSQVYLVHYTRAPDHLDHMRKELFPYGVKPLIIAAHDKDEFTLADRDCLSLFPNEISQHANNATRRELKKYCCRQLRKGEVSVCMKHMQASYDIVLNKHPISLVLEDDLAPCPGLERNITAMLKDIVSSLPPSWDIIQIGVPHASWGCHKRGPLSFYRMEFNTRATHSYLISLSGAMKMLLSLPLRCPIDYQMSLAPGGLTMFAPSTPLFIQLKPNGTHWKSLNSRAAAPGWH